MLKYDKLIKFMFVLVVINFLVKDGMMKERAVGQGQIITLSRYYKK